MKWRQCETGSSLQRSRRFAPAAKFDSRGLSQGVVSVQSWTGTTSFTDWWPYLGAARERCSSIAGQRRVLLHKFPGAEVARLRHDGKFLDLRQPALSQQLRPGISRHVTLVERGRGKRRRSEWESLRALSPLEARVAELSARGLPGKSVAYALGVAPATVSKHLATAAIKLGLPNRTRVAQLVGALLGVAPDLDAEARLTPSEREVLGLVRLGWSNQRIASARDRSERTVANQVSALLHKLRAPSRRALAAVQSRS